MKTMQSNSALFGANASFVEGVYESYLADPASVTAEWRSYFDTLQTAGKSTRDVAHTPIQRAFAALPEKSTGVTLSNTSLERKQVSVLQMINAHRFLGVRVANLDPLNRHAKPEVPELSPAHYGLTDADMQTTFETGSLVGAARMTLREIVDLLRQTYCGSIGAEYMYINDLAIKRWVQNRLEGARGKPNFVNAKSSGRRAR